MPITRLFVSSVQRECGIKLAAIFRWSEDSQCTESMALAENLKVTPKDANGRLKTMCMYSVNTSRNKYAFLLPTTLFYRGIIENVRELGSLFRNST